MDEQNKFQNPDTANDTDLSPTEKNSVKEKSEENISLRASTTADILNKDYIPSSREDRQKKSNSPEAIASRIASFMHISKKHKENQAKNKKFSYSGDNSPMLFDIPEGTRLPFIREKGALKKLINTLIALAVYLLLCLIVCLLSSFAVKEVAKIHAKASPDYIIENCIEGLSGNRLYGDIISVVKELKTKYETDENVSKMVLDAIYNNTDKNFHRILSSDNLLSYDIYASDNKIYNILLEQTASSDFIMDIDFWNVKEITFYKESLNAYKKSYLISAPANATVYLNGIELTRDYIVDNDYNFFVGSMWENEIPDEARCVLYSVDGIFGEPKFEASHHGEELETYRDESGIYHAKYPNGWVNDYRVSVPKGTLLYVNGILATAVHSSGSAAATVFEDEREGLTDIYLLESLFNPPRLDARFNDKPLGEPEANGTDYTFFFTEEMYYNTEITVPFGAIVKVNGITLTDENSRKNILSFEEWSSYSIRLNSYMPSELKSAGFSLPSFEKYYVSMLYSAPTIEVTLGDIVCTPFLKNIGDKFGVAMYDYPQSDIPSALSDFANSFAKAYIKYMYEGCYGIRDDVELRKNFYTNWINYLDYIMPDTLCYDSALDSYSDVEYRPNLGIIKQSFTVQNLVKYSDNLYCCSIVCALKDDQNEQESFFVINALIVIKDGQFKVWGHDTIA